MAEKIHVAEHTSVVASANTVTESKAESDKLLPHDNCGLLNKRRPLAATAEPITIHARVLLQAHVGPVSRAISIPLVIRQQLSNFSTSPASRTRHR
ncbi:hypothetical protein CERSUDRAFT_116700 [Gelatoporia subvermispora B]|uniref:Uncharacterized protein n=1 Tax=Ceriporiopsis subvermispora (strain B) TaxID=914234 RepID=M2R801_CERS8|nr:hypothetical protein CERSUDRAFT_116700 [Gelatoporia subvermispora B]